MNFQNIPRQDKLIKRAFGAKNDGLAFFDYAQIEYRLLGYYLAEQLGETRMAEAFKGGLDPHTVTAEIILDALGLEVERPLSDYYRQLGKTGNFSIVYAGGTPTIIRQLTRAGWKCDFKLAKRIRDAIRENMPEITRLEESIAEVLDERARSATSKFDRYGYLLTLWGRHLRPDPAIMETDGKRSAYRKMLNALIQGCAADLMREALRTTHKNLTEGGFRSHLVSTVHDEVHIDFVEDELPMIAEEVPKWMDYDVISAVVPVEVEMEVSYQSWADKEAYRV